MSPGVRHACKAESSNPFATGHPERENRESTESDASIRDASLTVSAAHLTLNSAVRVV